MRFFFSTGEASGDAYGAALVRAIRRLLPSTLDNPENSWSSFLKNRYRQLPDEARISEELIEIDSLELVELVMAIEDEFGIEVKEGEIKNLQTFGELRRYLAAQPGFEEPDAHRGASFQAVGGQRLRGEGVAIVADSSTWGAIGVVQSLKKFPKVWGCYRLAKKALRRGEPGVLVPIDFGFMNIRLARFAKSIGWKVVYFIPPGSWRKDRQGKDLPALCDEIITPFPWSAEMFRNMGARVHFFGHPLKQMIAEAGLKPSIQKPTEVGAPRIAVFPGSRQKEVELNLPVVAGTLKQGEVAEFAVAPNWTADELKALWQKLAPQRRFDIFTENDGYGVLKRARAAIICSGTAALEAALCHCPMVVIYKLSKMTELEMRIVKPKFDFIALPNILMGEEVVPELIQYDASPEKIREHLDSLVADGPTRDKQLKSFVKLDELLGPADAIQKSAEVIVKIGSSTG